MPAPYPEGDLDVMIAMHDDLTKRGRTRWAAAQEIQQFFKEQGVEYSARSIMLKVRRFRPTISLAQQYIKGQALHLAKRIIKHANVEQAIDVLTRPNIGVLAPVKQVETGGAGFFLSVSADSCGAVQVGVVNATAGRTLQSENGAEREEGPLSLRGESGGGNEESGDGGDSYPLGVRSRPEIIEAQPLQPPRQQPQPQEEVENWRKREGRERNFNSKSYREAVEDAKRRLAIAKKRHEQYERAKARQTMAVAEISAGGIEDGA